MARKISPIPQGYRTATPSLVVAGADAAITFYTAAFGATEQGRAVAADGISIALAKLKIGNSIIHLRDEAPALGIVSPMALGGSASAIHLYMADVDAVWQRAVEAGATVVEPLGDTFWGERFGTIIDPFGHVWSLSKRTEKLSADEITARATGDLAAAA